MPPDRSPAPPPPAPSLPARPAVPPPLGVAVAPPQVDADDPFEPV